MKRRDVLRLGAAAGLLPGRALGFGEASRVDICELAVGPGSLSRPNAWSRLLYEAEQTTSVECEPRSVRLAPDDPVLFQHPFAILPGDGGFADVGPSGLEQLERYLGYGGVLVLDDATGSEHGPFDDAVRRLVERLFPTRPLVPLPPDHSIYRSFFLLKRPLGRVDRFGYLEGVTFGSTSPWTPIVYMRNDLSGALDRTDDGRPATSCVPGGETQRREAIKLGINLVVYALTANYKRDQAHVKQLMKEGRLEMTAWFLGGPLGAGGVIEWTAPDWQIVAASVAALLAWVLAWIGRRPVGASLLESATWGLALLALVVAFAGPVWVLEEGRMEPGRVAVLVDASRSMSVLEDGTPRSDAVRGVLAEVARQVGSPDVYHFGDELAVGTPDHFDLPGTDLEQALDALSERVAGERLAGVVVISDGLDRGLLRKRFEKEEGALPPDAPGPLTVVQAGALDQVVDLSVHDVDAGGYAFIRAPFSVRAQLRGLGFAGRTVPVTLTRDGAPVTERRVTLDAEGNGEVTFDVVPEDAGRFAYAVQVPVYEGDAVPANNTLPVVVKVVRDRIRVLQVAGAPSWDVKFLRRFLEGDPSVQLVSFFILRTQRDLATSYTERELSLIQFPYERLFEEDLWTFDVVIFQNFDAENYFDPYQSGALLGNVRDYVENGGAFVMIGGDRSFGLGHYGATPLAELLPVELSRSGEQPDTAPFLPMLTAEGERHPITRLVAEAGENGEWWERLHPLDGTNVVLRAKPDAAVLLAHPTRKDADGRPLPILAVQEVGAGRSMALTVDASWRWSLSEAAQGRGNQAYLRFWKNAVRWLMRDATVSRVSVDTPRENYALGQDVRIVVRARDPGFGPIPGATVRVTVDNEGRVTELEGRTTADGDLVLSAPAEHVGTHRVRAEVTHDGRTVGTADTVFAVTSRDPELDEVAPDTRFLQWLASSTGGRYVGPGEDVQVLVDPDAARRVDERHETPLWRAPLLGAFVLACAGIAWIVRRSSGLR